MDMPDAVLPAVRHLERAGGRFTIDQSTVLDTPGFVLPERARIERLLRFLPFNLGRSAEGPPGRGNATTIRFTLEPESSAGASSLAVEGYRIDVSPEQVHVMAASIDGCSLAIATLRQLLPVDSYRYHPSPTTAWDLPCCSVVDAPMLAWRGLLLDVSRHFLPKHGVLRVLERMADLRLNRLQLHLSDDQGWRFESVRFPLLHEQGSHRSRSQLSHFNEPSVFDETPHGGYYSQDDLREIVVFAADRAIVVVPEIDLPGHTGALIAAYPELGIPRREHHEVRGEWGISRSLIAPTPEAMVFLGQLFDEITSVFPSPWIHVGGDESRLSVWQDDDATMAYAASIGLGSARELFAKFLTDLGSLVRDRGRTMITWDDAFAATPEAATDAVVMAWRGLGVARRAAGDGRKVILAPVLPLYFDYAQSDDAREPMAIGGPISLDDVARFDPSAIGWPDEQRRGVLGAQAQLWTEWVASEREIDFALFPRLCAFAEIAWTGAPADQGFADRLATHLRRLDAAGVEYRPLDGPRPWQQGGTGRRAHRSPWPLHDMLARLERAALSGTVAFGGDD